MKVKLLYFIFCLQIKHLGSLKLIIEDITLVNDDLKVISTNRTLLPENVYVDSRINSDSYILLRLKYDTQYDEDCKKEHVLLIIGIKKIGLKSYVFCGKGEINTESWKILKVQFNGFLNQFNPGFTLLFTRKNASSLSAESVYRKGEKNLTTNILIIIFVGICFSLTNVFCSFLCHKKNKILCEFS